MHGNGVLEMIEHLKHNLGSEIANLPTDEKTAGKPEEKTRHPWTEPKKGGTDSTVRRNSASW